MELFNPSFLLPKIKNKLHKIDIFYIDVFIDFFIKK